MGKTSLKYFILLGVVLFLSYYLFIVYDTREIMREFQQVIDDNDGVCNLKSKKLYVFRPHENYKTVLVFRYFTWCYKEKGKIWLYKKGEFTKSNGEISEVPDYFSVSIEKEEGEWIVNSINIVP